jgi:glycosyltransferase involved in cell wall biosynthesis
MQANGFTRKVPKSGSVMKVLQILDSLGRGGAERQVLEICNNAKDFGIDVLFVTFGRKSNDLEKDFLSSNVPFIKLKRRLPFDPALVVGLRKIIKQNRVKIVHSYQPVEALHAYAACFGLNIKKVLSFQGFIQDEKNWKTAQFLVPRMDANIIVSHGLKKWLSRRINFNSSFVQILHNGVDKKRLVAKGRKLRDELALHSEELLFGMIGNFYRNPRKDQMTICRSLPKVFKEVPRSRCVFVGGVEEGAEAKFRACVEFCRENRIADKVYFLNARTDIPEILASLDVFVFSSLHEGLPLAVCEAMLAGVPAVLADIEPLLEISQNGKYAEVFQTQNEKELAEKLIKLLRDEKYRKSLAQAAQKFAEENFSIEAHLKNLKKLYSSILSKEI